MPPFISAVESKVTQPSHFLENEAKKIRGYFQIVQDYLEQCLVECMTHSFHLSDPDLTRAGKR